LLAGGSPPGDPLTIVTRRGAPPALVRTARRLAGAEVDDVLARVARAGWRWVVPETHEFPPLLLGTADPPLGLFVSGQLPVAPAVAVVGSRRATPYGLQVARLVGESLAEAGVVVVSGMARGVDAAAHRGALDRGGATVAVWGTGPDRVYPPEHRRLAEAIAATGALITEYPPGTPARRYHFPERNRLVAGLAAATVVVEAAEKSGALGTARVAMEEGREVFAVPGPIFSDRSVGPNTLLRLGATPLLTPADLFDAVEPPRAAPPVPAAPEGVSGLLEHLPPGEAMSVDGLAAAAGGAVAGVLAELLRLELAGVVARDLDGRFRRASGMMHQR
jgi:DNA processing protein